MKPSLKQMMENFPKPRHHNQVDLMYYDFNEVQAWVLKYVQPFEKELREEVDKQAPFTALVDAEEVLGGSGAEKEAK